MNRRLVLVSMFFAILNVPWLSCSAEAQESQTAQETEIREAVIRYQIANWDLHADVYFIEIQSKDPGKDFLNRFANDVTPVKGKSASRRKKDVAGFHVEDRQTKKRGVVFGQESIIWKDGSTVAVEGGYYCASLCMASGVYHLKKHDGRWGVAEFKINIQS